MDHENLCIASRETWDTEEVDMVLGQCKGRFVPCRIGALYTVNISYSWSDGQNSPGVAVPDVSVDRSGD